MLNVPEHLIYVWLSRLCSCVLSALAALEKGAVLHQRVGSTLLNLRRFMLQWKTRACLVAACYTGCLHGSTCDKCYGCYGLHFLTRIHRIWKLANSTSIAPPYARMVLCRVRSGFVLGYIAEELMHQNKLPQNRSSPLNGVLIYGSCLGWNISFSFQINQSPIISCIFVPEMKRVSIFICGAL